MYLLDLLLLHWSLLTGEPQSDDSGIEQWHNGLAFDQPCDSCFFVACSLAAAPRPNRWKQRLEYLLSAKPDRKDVCHVLRNHQYGGPRRQ